VRWQYGDTMTDSTGRFFGKARGLVRGLAKVGVSGQIRLVVTSADRSHSATRAARSNLPPANHGEAMWGLAMGRPGLYFPLAAELQSLLPARMSTILRKTYRIKTNSGWHGVTHGTRADVEF